VLGLQLGGREADGQATLEQMLRHLPADPPASRSSPRDSQHDRQRHGLHQAR
jgi:hypothetical protein